MSIGRLAWLDRGPQTDANGLPLTCCPRFVILTFLAARSEGQEDDLIETMGSEDVSLRRLRL